MSDTASQPMEAADVVWTGEVHEDGELCFRLGREGDKFIAEWPGICTLRARADGAWSELLPAPGADRELVDKLHGGLAKALLRHLSGELTLHASAAVIDGVAVACAGESEAGKSTTAAALVAHHGGELLADDTLALVIREGYVGVQPTERVSWLLRDARAAFGLPSDETWSKVPIAPKRAARGEARLGALVLLAWDDELPGPRVRRLRGHEAVASLVPSVVRFVVDEPARNRREMEQLADLTQTVPVYELVRPHRMELLSATSDELRALARAAGGRP